MWETDFDDTNDEYLTVMLHNANGNNDIFQCDGLSRANYTQMPTKCSNFNKFNVTNYLIDNNEVENDQEFLFFISMNISENVDSFENGVNDKKHLLDAYVTIECNDMRYCNDYNPSLYDYNGINGWTDKQGGTCLDYKQNNNYCSEKTDVAIFQNFQKLGNLACCSCGSQPQMS